ncbi:MAG TPA: COQ9 family protein [Sphingomicrobium sp.]|nr:COQ9 family protein [Sphingomicrobium sp.]
MDEQPSPLQEIRERLALAVGENAVFDGWTQAAVDAAAGQVGIDPAQARLAMPNDQAGKIDLYMRAVDRELRAWFRPERLEGLKIREKIRAIIWKRLEIMAPARESVRRALSILAMPQNLPTALKASWRSADVMSRIAGDTSTDFNHYTKRVTLGGVYASTLLVWLDDQTEGWSETAAFLDRRIDDVMRFEKFKAQWKGQEHFSVSRFLGRLRYPAR